MKAAIIGGDKRMLYAAKAFSDCGAEVRVAGFENMKNLHALRTADWTEALCWADICVLPVRPVSDGVLNCPFGSEKITPEQFALQNCGKPVFCGNSNSLAGVLHTGLYDYAAREDFAVENAVLTAEGALGLLLREYEDSLCRADVLILGCGRIGKVLMQMLSALGAKVTVAARKPSDRAWIRCFGLTPDDYSFKELSSHTVIINTVPALVLNSEQIGRLHDGALLIDLASAEGGMDHDAARQRGLTCIHALALPGKTAPIAAGRIIQKTIIQMIKEDNGGKDNTGLCNDRLLLHL